jgi:hypothetical protein
MGVLLPQPGMCLSCPTKLEYVFLTLPPVNVLDDTNKPECVRLCPAQLVDTSLDK